MGSRKTMRTFVLVLTMLGVVVAFAVLACGPAASAPQASQPSESGDMAVDDALSTAGVSALPQGSGGVSSDGEKPTATATLTPTSTPICWDVPVYGGEGRMSPVCELPGPPESDFAVRMALKKHKERSAKRARGEPVEPITVNVRIYLETQEAADQLLDLLETELGEVGVARLGVNRDGRTWWAAYVWVLHLDAGLIEPIYEMGGVLKMSTIAPMSYGGSRLQQTPAVAPTLTAAQLTHADQWHRAGFTGAGVGVAVIDSSFQDFETRVLPMLSRPVRFFCYDSSHNIVEGQLPALPDGPDFDVCEDGSLTNPDHGTDVAAALAEIAPDADLYIVENPTGYPVEIVFLALDWLIHARGPLSATMPDRSFNVKVINNSAGALWDGPGDGNSRDGNDVRSSLLAAVDYAESNGVLWVNSSGNKALGTWFGRDPDFHDTGHYLPFTTLGTDFGCNLVTIEAGKDYFFQMRGDGAWSHADVNLSMVLRGPNEVEEDRRLFYASTGMQTGEETHVPFDMLSVSGSDALSGFGLAKGQYCLFVTKDPEDDDPDWVQLQVYRPDQVELQYATSTGSLNNPSESDNDGMLSVGAASNTALPIVQPFSGRGPAPAPHPPDRVALDFVGGVFEGAAGTSFASPRVAGLAALVIGALGHLPDYDRPSEVVQYLKRIPRGPFADPMNDDGYGFLALPPLDSPDDLRLEQISCGASGNLRVAYDPPAEEISLPFVSQLYVGEVRVVDNPDLDVVLRVPRTGTTSRTVRALEGEVYQAKVKTCVAGVGSGEDLCGPEATSSDFLLLAEVCRPRGVRAIAGDGIVTVRWNEEADATEYKVEREGAGTVPTSDEYWVFDGLTNGTEYRFRVMAEGPLGTSEWSSWYRATPRSSSVERLSALGAIVDASAGDLFKQNDVILSWFPRHDAARYEVRVWDGTKSKWRILPTKPRGWDQKYRAVFEYGFGEVKVGIRGLIPGTGYAFQVRGVNGEKRSPLSERITVITPGSRPSDAPSLAVIPPPKMPPSELVAVTSGTSAVLSWELGTNPNYVRQLVLRRERASSAPWVEIAVGLSDTTYTDTGLTSGRAYIYRIRAEKETTGEDGSGGGVSNRATVTIR